MKASIKAILPAVLLAFAAALNAETPAPAGKTVFVTGTPNYCAQYEAMLAPAKVKVVKSSAKTDSKKWLEQGQIIPKFDELKQYDAVIVAPLVNLLANNKEDIVKYVANGGTVMFFYNSLETTKQKTKELGFGICGFDKLEPVHAKPYPKAGDMLHKLKYTERMGVRREWEKMHLYTNYASDLMDAEALVVNPDLPGKAVATISKHGKGFFIFYGAEDNKVIRDLFKLAGLTR